MWQVDIELFSISWNGHNGDSKGNQRAFINWAFTQNVEKKRNLTQSELAKISGVSLRAIKAYEQGKLDISKAQGGTLYKLSKALDCAIEDLIK